MNEKVIQIPLVSQNRFRVLGQQYEVMQTPSRQCNTPGVRSKRGPVPAGGRLCRRRIGMKNGDGQRKLRNAFRQPYQQLWVLIVVHIDTKKTL